MIHVHEAACPQNHPCPAVSYCPAGAIVQDSIFAPPRVDQELCTDCGACTRVCHVFAQVPDSVASRL
jgi:Fe-S-cluster-containing hydrogenase component 2